MAAAATDLLQEVGIATATTLDAPGYTIGGTSVTVASTANMPTATGITFAMDVIDSDGVQVPGSYNEYVGTVATGTSITNVSHQNGTDRNYSAGSTTRVYIPVSAERENRIVTWGTTEHSQLGTHTAVTATSLAVSGATTLTGALTIKSYDGWINTADTWTYASATTFTIAGVDRTAQFPVGTKIKLTQTTAKYFYVTGSAFGTDTTVTITGGSDYTLANAAITSPALSYDATPQGFPDYFSYSPTLSGRFNNGKWDKSCKFTLDGKKVTAELTLTANAATPMDGGTAESIYTLPVTSRDYVTTEMPILGNVSFVDTGTALFSGVSQWVSTTTAHARVNLASGTYAQPASTTSAVPFTWVSGDKLFISISYEAA